MLPPAQNLHERKQCDGGDHVHPLEIGRNSRSLRVMIYVPGDISLILSGSLRAPIRAAFDLVQLAAASGRMPSSALPSRSFSTSRS
jgi:hypothetical protein